MKSRPFAQTFFDCVLFLLESFDLLFLRGIVRNAGLVESARKFQNEWSSRGIDYGAYGFSGDFWNCLNNTSCGQCQNIIYWLIRWQVSLPGIVVVASRGAEVIT